MTIKRIAVTEDVILGGEGPPALIAGPCVIEDEALVRDIAASLKEIAGRLSLPFVFKASFDKANRSSLRSYRGPGMKEGLRILEKIKKEYAVPVTTDVHDVAQVKEVSLVADVLQIPAFLSRQTDLLIAASQSGRAVNVKKGQFLAPWDVKNIIEKCAASGCERLILTERGTSFGYNQLITDFRALPIMREFGYPVIFDATHSVQAPGGKGESSGGERRFIPHLVRAAVAVGCDGVFLEVHPDPDKGLSDGANMLPLDEVETLLTEALAIRKALDHVTT
ncbi:MAG: 3-deoxy-8-phosphooctulonate synthase [Candidatus Omnitrophica bacterium]|nr:3-deoxy-8-phosphooctulonate synthase [Candidatus Omnitrophota bacterium]